MTELLQEALRRLEELSPSDQNAVAGAMIDYMGQLNELRLTDEQIAEVRRRMADPNPVLMSLDEVREHFKTRQA